MKFNNNSNNNHFNKHEKIAISTALLHSTGEEKIMLMTSSLEEGKKHGVY